MADPTSSSQNNSNKPSSCEAQKEAVDIMMDGVVVNDDDDDDTSDSSSSSDSEEEENGRKRASYRLVKKTKIGTTGYVYERRDLTKQDDDDDDDDSSEASAEDNNNVRKPAAASAQHDHHYYDRSADIPRTLELQIPPSSFTQEGQQQPVAYSAMNGGEYYPHHAMISDAASQQISSNSGAPPPPITTIYADPAVAAAYAAITASRVHQNTTTASAPGGASWTAGGRLQSTTSLPRSTKVQASIYRQLQYAQNGGAARFLDDDDDEDYGSTIASFGPPPAAAASSQFAAANVAGQQQQQQQRVMVDPLSHRPVLSVAGGHTTIRSHGMGDAATPTVITTATAATGGEPTDQAAALELIYMVVSELTATVEDQGAQLAGFQNQLQLAAQRATKAERALVRQGLEMRQLRTQCHDLERELQQSTSSRLELSSTSKTGRAVAVVDGSSAAADSEVSSSRHERKSEHRKHRKKSKKKSKKDRKHQGDAVSASLSKAKPAPPQSTTKNSEDNMAEKLPSATMLLSQPKASSPLPRAANPLLEPKKNGNQSRLQEVMGMLRSTNPNTKNNRGSEYDPLVGSTIIALATTGGGGDDDDDDDSNPYSDASVGMDSHGGDPSRNALSKPAMSMRQNNMPRTKTFRNKYKPVLDGRSNSSNNNGHHHNQPFNSNHDEVEDSRIRPSQGRRKNNDGSEWTSFDSPTYL